MYNSSVDRIFNLDAVERNRYGNTAFGAACLAGLGSGVYSSLQDIARLWQSDVRCEPKLETAARGNLLWRLVDGLPACQADLIRRSFISGQSHQQIAEETGLPLGTVKSRIRLGLDKLRGALRTAATLEGVDC